MSLNLSAKFHEYLFLYFVPALYDQILNHTSKNSKNTASSYGVEQNGLYMKLGMKKRRIYKDKVYSDILITNHSTQS